MMTKNSNNDIENLSKLKAGETYFNIKGKINIFIIVSAISSILSIGGLIANVKYCSDRISKLEDKSLKVDENYVGVISTLIRIEENSKFLKEKIFELKSSKSEEVKYDL